MEHSRKDINTLISIMKGMTPEQVAVLLKIAEKMCRDNGGKEAESEQDSGEENDTEQDEKH